MNNPKTLEEAKATVYGRWAGHPKGSPWRSNQCAFTVWPGGRGQIAHQCYQKPGHGPATLYCKTHADLVCEDKGETWFRATSSGVSEVLVTKSTDSFVWVREGGHINKIAKIDQWHAHFHERNQAIEFLISKERNAIRSAENVIERSQKRITELESLK